jgi:hypothetical protein
MYTFIYIYTTKAAFSNDSAWKKKQEEHEGKTSSTSVIFWNRFAYRNIRINETACGEQHLRIYDRDSCARKLIFLFLAHIKCFLQSRKSTLIPAVKTKMQDGVWYNTSRSAKAVWTYLKMFHLYEC